MKAYAGKLLLNGESMKLDHELIVAGSSVFIPMRDVFEMLGAEVSWNQATQTVTAVIGDRTIKHRPLADTVEVNGVSVDITASRIVGNTVLLPLRNISELIGYRVEWNGKAKEIRITA